MLSDLLISFRNDEADVWTLKTPLFNEEQIKDPNLAKVVCDAKGFALYFSRSPIPYYRNSEEDKRKYFKHIGLYAYSEEALKKISLMQPCPLSRAESLEQLRFLSHGLKIQVNETAEETIGIDLPEHLAAAEQYIHLQSNGYGHGRNI